ncbi:glycosyltransferase family 2 protein [Ancylobacter oerskovii]|nr:glycosyltransferase family 2 protein [Ancylobacter oerskovii]
MKDQEILLKRCRRAMARAKQQLDLTTAALTEIAIASGLNPPKRRSAEVSLPALLGGEMLPPVAIKLVEGQGLNTFFLLTERDEGGYRCEKHGRHLPIEEIIARGERDALAHKRESIWFAEEFIFSCIDPEKSAQKIRFYCLNGSVFSILLKSRQKGKAVRAYYEPVHFARVGEFGEGFIDVDIKEFPKFRDTYASVIEIARKTDAFFCAVDVLQGKDGAVFSAVSFEAGDLAHMPLTFQPKLERLADTLETEGPTVADQFSIYRRRSKVSANLQQQIDTIRSSGLFQLKWYNSQFSDRSFTQSAAIEHFLTEGAKAGKSPNKNFDAEFYASQDLGIAEDDPALFLHYIEYGRFEGRLTSRSSCMRKVRMQELNLWGGASDAAAAELRACIADPRFDEFARFEAGRRLAAWLAFQGENLEADKILAGLSSFAPRYFNTDERVIMHAMLHFQAGDMPKAKHILSHYNIHDNNSNLILANSNIIDSDEDRLSEINRIFKAKGLSQLRLINQEKGLSISNIYGEPAVRDDSHYGKVSVIVPTFNAEGSIETAIRSLVQQTYQDLEIIVVDDCSDDETFSIVNRLAAGDQRIVPLRQERNSGAYAARNRGLQIATGDYITTHDADDWSHPQKIASQLRHLSEKDGAIAVLAHWIRARHSMHFTTNWRLTDRLIHWSHSSFLFKREVTDRFGGWDDVRVSADTEFIWRVQSAFGKDSVAKVLPDVPLAFALDDGASLTRTKLTHVSTTYFGLRHYYREISRYWHELSGGHLSSDQIEKKMQMIPREMVSRNPPVQDLAVHVIGDFRNPKTVRKMAVEISAISGLVGVSHQPDPSFDLPEHRLSRFCDEFFEILGLPNVSIVLNGAEFRTRETRRIA